MDQETNQIQNQVQKRKVGFLLGIGIFFFPVIFAWFTLRKGHSTVAKVVSFVWLAIALLFTFSGAGKEHKPTVPSSAISAKTTESTSSNSTESTTDISPAAPEEEVYRTTATELFQDYEDNEVAADDKMKNKSVEVTGSIQSIDKDFMDNIILRLKTKNRFMSAGLTLDDSQKDDAMKLKKGDKVVVTCKKMKRIVGSPMGTNCVLHAG